MIISIRTDKPDAEVGVFDGEKQLNYCTWHADRDLARDLLKIMHQQLLKVQADWDDVTGVVVFEGPGSFTGLRIGITVANTLAYAQNIPIVGTQGEDWVKNGLKLINSGKNHKLVLPHYGAEANITKPKH